MDKTLNTSEPTSYHLNLKLNLIMLNILIEDRHSQEGAETTMEVTTN